MKRVEKDNMIPYLDIGTLDITTYGNAIAYVIGGKCKTAVNGQPFYVLYLKDCNGDSITGFKFNVADYIHEGLSLEKIKNKFIVIKYYVNDADGFTRTLVLENVFLVEDQNAIDATVFIGTTPADETTCNQILDIFSSVFGIKINLSKIKMLVRNYEYCQGKTGGVIYHHYITLQSLQQYRDILTETEYRELIFCYMMFLVIHLEYVANDCQDMDSEMINRLLMYSRNFEDKLNVRCGTAELIFYFSGVTPKGFCARTITSTFENTKKVLAEMYVNRITPLMQTGDAGYGKIKRYY